MTLESSSWALKMSRPAERGKGTIATSEAKPLLYVACREAELR